MTIITRRSALKFASALPLAALAPRTHAQRRLTVRLATGQDPTHPVNVRAKEAAAQILDATDGRVQISVFPAAQLGGDQDLISQVRSGGVEMINMAGTVLSTVAPLTGILSTGFAFDSYDKVWQATDGALGAHIRRQIEARNMVCPFKFWCNGFRQLSTGDRAVHTPADIANMKLRVPQSRPLIDLISALGAAATPLNFTELYTALQTKLVDGQENPLAVFSSNRLYEVQTHLSLTGHVFDPYIMLVSPTFWRRLDGDTQELFVRAFDAASSRQRRDIQTGDQAILADLTAKGIQITRPDVAAFRRHLAASPYYAESKRSYGATEWAALEATTGALGA